MANQPKFPPLHKVQPVGLRDSILEAPQYDADEGYNELVPTPQQAAQEALSKGATPAQAGMVGQVVSIISAGQTIDKLPPGLPARYLPKSVAWRVGKTPQQIAQALERTVYAPSPVMQVVIAIQQLRDDIYNSSIINNARAYALAFPKTSTISSVAANSPQQVWLNKTGKTCVAYIRVEDANADIRRLWLSTGIDAAVDLAPVGVYTSGLDASVIVKPNTQVWAGFDGNSGSTGSIILTAIPLRGKAILI